MDDNTIELISSEAAGAQQISDDRDDDCRYCTIIVRHLHEERPPRPISGFNAPIDQSDYTSRWHKSVCPACKTCLEDDKLHEIGNNLKMVHGFMKIRLNRHLKKARDYLTKRRLNRFHIRGCALCVFFMQQNCLLQRLPFVYSENVDIPMTGNMEQLNPSSRRPLGLERRVLLVTANKTRITKAHRRSGIFSDVIIRPIYMPQIHWPLVISWLKTCERDHGDKCNTTVLKRNSHNMNSLILIDVHGKRLVERDHDCRYITLSYVWGQVSQLQLTTANRNLLFEDGSLERFNDRLPQVVRDATQAVIAMGESLLWVDSLCIPQDDALSKHHFLQEMATIYHGALITLVALHGRNAQAGLPGVRMNTRCYDLLGTRLGVHIAQQPSFETVLKDSTYEARAWTFQERYLSRRCLYFTGAQVFLTCNSHDWQEDKHTEYRDPSTHYVNYAQSSLRAVLASAGLKESWVSQLLQYARTVETYLGKQLTFDSDVLNAFAGIDSLFHQVYGWSFVCGLPETWLEHTLLWEQLPTTKRRSVANSDATEYANIQPDSIVEFPTWSWAAWVGGIKYNEWTRSNLRRLHSPLFISDVSGTRPLNHCRLGDSEHKDCLTDEVTIRDPEGAPKHSLPDYHSSKPNVLFFSSPTVPASAFQFSIMLAREGDGHGMLMDQNSRCCGTVPGVDLNFDQKYSDAHVDLILLAACEMSTHRFLSLSDWRRITFFDYGFSKDKWSVLTVLLIKWENGYAYRIALGYIHQDAWKQAQPRQRFIKLA